MTATPRFRIFQAYAKDAEQLKLLYSEKSRDGSIQVNLDRNPDFFEALRVEGSENLVYVVEDTQTGLLAGAGIRSIRECYINGEVNKIGYLSGLRVAENYRKSRAMAMIFTKLRQLYLQGECPGYLCSVFNSNKTAIKVLTSGKAGMPVFLPVGQLNTFVFKPVSIYSKKVPAVICRPLQNFDTDKLVAFLNTEGAKQQYFPFYTKKDFSQPEGILKNLNIRDIYIALENNEIIGSLALWDQTAFRLWKVQAYSQSLRILKPFINTIFYFSSLPQLPEPGSGFNYRFLSLICIRNNDTSIFTKLYNLGIRTIPKKEKILISCSIFKGNPLIHSLPKFKMSFKSSIFIGFWKETQSEIDKIDQRSPYIEAGSL